MAITDFGTVRCFADDNGVDVYFGRGDDVTKEALKSLRGRWNPVQKRWRVASDAARKPPQDIIAAIGAAITAAAPEWWTNSLPKLSRHACVTRAYGLKIGIGGMRIDLPAGHPLDWTFENKVPGAVRDGRSWLVPPDGVRTPEARAGVERVMREDKEIFLAAAAFIGPRRIRGVLHADAAETARLALAKDAPIAADLSFFSVADPETQVGELVDWCLYVESLDPAPDGGYQAVLAYANAEPAFGFLRTRRADPMPPPCLGSAHVKTRWEKAKSGR